MDLNSLSLKDAALEYCRMGYSVIPCDGKRPQVEWKSFQDETPDDDTIDFWWDAYPDANVALVLGRGVFAVDIDGPEGRTALADAGVKFPANTPMSLTGKGVHYLFRGETGDRIRILPKVDIKGKGIIVVPPSVHSTGKKYTWLVPPDTIPEAPDALRRLLLTPANREIATQGGSWLSEALKGVGEGVRNATCARLAGYFLGKGMAPDDVIELLLGWADRCRPRFPSHEVELCVKSISQREGIHTDEPVSLSDGLLSVGKLYDTAPDEHEWVVEDYIPRGSLVMLSSEEKVGKSTLIYALMSAIVGQSPFLGRKTTPCPILMLAVEEHKVDVKLRAKRFGLLPEDPVQFFIGDLGTDDQTMRDLRDTISSTGSGLVILDTLGHHISQLLESENDNLGAIKALRPWLHLARETGAAVVIIHHAGKQGGMYRGASALGGIVDQILTLRNEGDNRRSIEARGRYATTPRMTRIALEGNEYRVLFSE